MIYTQPTSSAPTDVGEFLQGLGLLYDDLSGSAR